MKLYFGEILGVNALFLSDKMYIANFMNIISSGMIVVSTISGIVSRP